MASTTALYAALSGMNVNSRSLDVIGNNVANVNTTAFKGSRTLFSNMFSRNLSEGTAPTQNSGGTNPSQIGLGVQIGGIQKQHVGGTISATGNANDLAIDGDGFFVVNDGGVQKYTRDGSFGKNAADELVTIGGARVMGYGVDSEYNIIDGQLQPISIPLGRDSVAIATTQVHMSGNLNAAGDLPTRGSRITLNGTATTGLIAITTATPPPATGNRVESATRLVDIEDPAQSGTDTPLFSSGQTLQLQGAEKGSKVLPTRSLAITSATTIADLNQFLADSMGIDTTTGQNPDGRTPGVTVDPTTGSLTVVGNSGSANDIRLDASDLRLLDSSGGLVRSPFVPAKNAAADGESVRTSFVTYNSLGAEVVVDVTLVAESRSNAGTAWRYYLESGNDTDPNRQLTTGTIRFDTAGQLLTTDPITINVDLDGTGAGTPLSFELSFASSDGNVTALADDDSQLAAVFRNGSPLGSLSSFGVGADGTITGSYSNGLTRTLGRVVVAKFSSNEGLVDDGDNMFRVGADSGNAQILTPGSLGAGKVVSGSLELSNVDLSSEFIKMVQASTGFSANSRVIRTVDELMQQLLVLGR